MNGPTWKEDRIKILRMMERGAESAAGLALVLILQTPSVDSLFEALLVLLLGTLKGPGYYVGNKVPCEIKYIRKGPELSELIYGFTRCFFIPVLISTGRIISS